MNILVTGAGALLGQGILRSLNQMEEEMTIHTCDPNWRSGGHWLGHYAHNIPSASKGDYLEKLEKLIDVYKIDLLFIGTDTELPIIAAKKTEMEREFGVKIVVSNINVIDIANDKYKTAKFLEENNFPFPYSVLSIDTKGVQNLREKAEYPYFAKPVDGARSKGIVRVNDEKMLNEITSTPNNLVIQEFISEEEGEFTSGCLMLDGEPAAVVTLKRDLRDGNTYRAFYEKSFSKYDGFIIEVATKLGVEGPCNFQFRIRNGQPVIFEINARFSGTTPLRSFFGFNEVESTVQYYLCNKKIVKPVLKEGEVLRVWADLFVPKEEADRFKAQEKVEKPAAEYYPFKK